MNEPNDHERVTEILRRAQRPAEEINPETLAENLRWLIRTGRPRATASVALRQRVQRLIAAEPPRRPSLLARLLSVPVLPKGLLATAAAGVAAVLISLSLAGPSPADALERTLGAMARVRSAHCTGLFSGIVSTSTGGRPIQQKMAVQWWYKTPDRYRQEAVIPGSPHANSPGRLIINGQRADFRAQPGADEHTFVAFPKRGYPDDLSPVDFFLPEGILMRAQRQGKARIVAQPGTYHGQSVLLLTVAVQGRKGEDDLRQEWLLTVDPGTNLLLRSESRYEQRAAGEEWRLVDHTTLDQFEYNVEVPDQMFVISESPPGQRKLSGRSNP